MNAFTLKHVLLWEKDTNTYFEHDVDSIKWLNSLLIASSTDELNILVNENFDLLPTIEQGGIVRLNIVLDEMFFVSEAVLRSLNTWLKQYSQEGTSKIVGENIAILMLHFLACIVRLSDVNKIPIEEATYVLEGLTKFSV